MAEDLALTFVFGHQPQGEADTAGWRVGVGGGGGIGGRCQRYMELRSVPEYCS